MMEKEWSKRAVGALRAWMVLHDSYVYLSFSPWDSTARGSALPSFLMRTAHTYLAASFLLIVTLACFKINAGFDNSEQALLKGRDVMFIWQDAKLLADGLNPYQRIAGKNMEDNQKYTFYLPAFLIMTAGTIQAGLDTFPEWMRAWRWGMLFTHLAIGYVIFGALIRYGMLPAMLGCSLWIFGRWSLMLFNSGQIDGTAILPMLVSLLLVGSHPRGSALLFGLSVAVKQMAAPLLPLYLLWAWQRAGSGARLRECVTVVGLVSLVPLLLSLPFLFWDAESYLRMLIFPMTRAGFGGRTADIYLGLSGLAAKLPFLLVLGIAYWLAVRHRVNVWAQSLLVFMVLLSFSPAFFTRYLCWVVPLIPLALFDRDRGGCVVDGSSATYENKSGSIE